MYKEEQQDDYLSSKEYFNSEEFECFDPDYEMYQNYNKIWDYDLEDWVDAN